MKKRKLNVIAWIMFCVLISSSIFMMTACSNMVTAWSNLFGGEKAANKKTVTVTLDPNGGEVEKKTIIGFSGEPMELPTPIRSNCTFDSWYQDWSIVDNTVFADNDVTLIARYYTTEDLSVSFSHINPEVNKLLGSSDGGTSWTWGNIDFTASDWGKIIWLRKNGNTIVNVVINFEAIVSGIGGAKMLGGKSNYVLSTASTDVIKKGTLSNWNSWETVTINADITANKFYGSGNIMALRFSPTLGSMGQYYRNITATFSYTVPSGVLI